MPPVGTGNGNRGRHRLLTVLNDIDATAELFKRVQRDFP